MPLKLIDKWPNYGVFGSGKIDVAAFLLTFGTSGFDILVLHIPWSSGDSIFIKIG